MQYDMESLEQPLLDQDRPKSQVWSEIGAAEVTHTFWGRAKVRVHRKRDDVKSAFGWGVILISLWIGSVWLVQDALH
jgi:hypothetical protein